MIQFDTEILSVDGIPARLIHPLRADCGRAAVFYHGWSSTGALQTTRAAVLAAHGYTVLLPDAVYHGARGTLPDYYSIGAYESFWQAIFQNVREFPALSAFLASRGFATPWVLGHSMGGMTVLGIAAEYPDGIRGAVSFNGSGDWLLTHLFIQARFGVLEPRDWPLYDAIAAASPLAHLDAVRRVPVFMTNGEADPSIDPRAQAHFADELDRAGGRAVRRTYPRLAHFVTTNMLDDAIAWMEAER